MKKLNLLLFIGTFFILKTNAQEWVVPQDKLTKGSPFQFNTETAKKGELVFSKNCISCHGTPGKANFVNLTPSPGDPATDKFQKQTDGALFFKITTGRSPMPQFKDILSEEERWQVISYFRSFNKSYVQPDVASKGQAANVQNAFLTISFSSASNQVKALATDSAKKPIKGAEIALFVKRYFGNMQIGDPTTTNEAGIAFFNFPKDLPGDKNGNVDLIAKLNSEGSDIQKMERLAIGVPTDKPPLTSKRAMWNVMSKAPIWLLLSYFGVVLVIWGFIVYIVLQLVKMRNESKIKSSSL